MPTGCRVLLVEDEKAPRLPIRDLLSDSGYVTTTATEGADLPGKYADSLPCVVLLNLLPAKASGARLLDIVRASPRTAGLPVIAIGGVPRELGGVAMALGRPLEPVALIAAVEVACYGHHHSPTAQPPRAPPPIQLPRWSRSGEPTRAKGALGTAALSK